MILNSLIVSEVEIEDKNWVDTLVTIEGMLWVRALEFGAIMSFS
jgi:hypothetical protein